MKQKQICTETTKKNKNCVKHQIETSNNKQKQLVINHPPLSQGHSKFMTENSKRQKKPMTEK